MLNTSAEDALDAQPVEQQLELPPSPPQVTPSTTAKHTRRCRNPQPSFAVTKQSTSSCGSIADLHHQNPAVPLPEGRVDADRLDFADVDLSFHITPHWMHLTELPEYMQYRRILHQYFAHVHFVHPHGFPRGSTIATCANLITATIGLETLSMPYAAHQCGFTLFVIFGLITYGFTVWANFVFCLLEDATRLYSPEMLTRRILGSHRMELFVEVILVLACFGGAVAYNVVVADLCETLMVTFFGHADDTTFRQLVRFCSLVVLYVTTLQPLALVRTFSALKYFSFAGVAGIVLLVLFMVSDGLAHGNRANLQPAFAGSVRGILSAAPLLFLGFTNQVNAIEMYGELKKRSARSFAKYSSFCVGFVFCAFMLVGYNGLIIFGAAVDGNVLKSYTEVKSALGIAAMVSMLIKALFTFPLFMFPLREALLHIVGVQDVRQVSTTTFACVSVAIAFSTLICAVNIPEVIVMFGLSGSLNAGLFAFILPAWLAFKEPKYWSRLEGNEFWVMVHVLLNGTMLSIGLIVSIGGTFVFVTSI